MANHSFTHRIHHSLVSQAKRFYSEQRVEAYRASDMGYLCDKTKHFDMFQALGELTEQLGRPIRALDFGCGTGRYFHALRNTTHILGVDVSPEMIKVAHNPIQSQLITAQVTLQVASIFDVDFPPSKFDFIYCNGVLGQWAMLTPSILNRVWNWLETGYFLCTIITEPEAAKTTWKHGVVELAKPWLPQFIKSYLAARQKQFAMTEEQIRRVVADSNFKTLRLCRRLSLTGRIDLICVMGKESPLPTKLAGHPLL